MFAEREYRLIEQWGRYTIQYRFLGLFWKTAHKHQSLEDAMNRRNNDEIVRWHLWSRREHEKRCWAEIKARG